MLTSPAPGDVETPPSHGRHLSLPLGLPTPVLGGGVHALQRRQAHALRAPFHGLYPLLTDIFTKVHKGKCQPLGTEPAGKEAWERGLGPGETHPILPADPGNRAVKLGRSLQGLSFGTEAKDRRGS